jgi:predicted enzyme related to lactoylglutathione lyase
LPYANTKLKLLSCYLTPNGQPGPVAFWHVSDIKNSLQLVLNAGGQTQQAVRDVGGGKLVATARDAEGNLIGFIQMP